VRDLSRVQSRKVANTQTADKPNHPNPANLQPTPAHYFLTLLHRKSVLLRVFSQNIDTLDLLADLPPEQLVEAHGSFASAHCLKCGKLTSNEYVLRAGVRTGRVVKCQEKVLGRPCWGLVKPDIVFFGDGLPTRFAQRMQVGIVPRSTLR
jgi:NAD-dependent histone deacetylase SIR2